MYINYYIAITPLLLLFNKKRYLKLMDYSPTDSLCDYPMPVRVDESVTNCTRTGQDRNPCSLQLRRLTWRQAFKLYFLAPCFTLFNHTWQRLPNGPHPAIGNGYSPNSFLRGGTRPSKINLYTG
jgi:hypothetical protein